MATAQFLAKASGVLAGLRVAELVCEEVDVRLRGVSPLHITWEARDGDRVRRGAIFGEMRGPALSVVVAERTVLNIMQRMSGIATLTRAMVTEIERVGSKTRILDTRKTVPTLRVLDKMAVAMGGGVNHRFGLYDMVMIKDNHVTAANGVVMAVQRVAEFLAKRPDLSHVKVELETRTLEEVRQALELTGLHRIMLDNMVTVQMQPDGTVSVDTSMLENALVLINGKVETEASGNVTLDTVGAIAKTGVTYISSGQLTHSVEALDISLKIKTIA
jgi:nicotinate-nucleotide pyrophosphorylase (carboxylating)